MAGGGFVTFLLAGILQHIKPLRLYAMIARIISVVVAVIGIFFYGGAGVLAIQQAAVKEAEHKIELAKQASDSSNKLLAYALANKKTVIKYRASEIKKVIVHDKELINADCQQINDRAWEDYNLGVANKGDTSK